MEKKKLNIQVTKSYRKWWEAFTALGQNRPWGWQKELAEQLGCSVKHISMVYSGKARASAELQEKIAEYFGVPYHKMVEHGEDILKALKETEPFPRYHEVMSLPRRKRFDMIVQIAKEQAETSLVAFDDKIRKSYEAGQLSEKEVYEKVVALMKKLKGAHEPENNHESL
jgi:transcriptional regulator with XRE-family HTH domain